MRIGYDLDNIFIDTPPFIPDSLIEWLYGKRTNGKLEYRLPSKRGQLFRKATHIPLFRPPIIKNITFLQKIDKSKHNLYLISSRYGFLKQITLDAINRHKLNTIFNELHFNFDNLQPHIFKNELIKKYNIERYIDDDLHLLKYIASKNNHVKLYWLNKKINKKISGNIKAITNISAMLDE